MCCDWWSSAFDGATELFVAGDYGVLYSLKREDVCALLYVNI